MKSNEKGSVTMIVVAVVLFIVILLSSFLIYVSARRRSQLEATNAISEAYDGDMQEIYAEIVSENEILEVEIVKAAEDEDLTLMQESSSGTATDFLGGEITRGSIESISFVTYITGHSADDYNCWDVSETQNGFLLAWYGDSDGDGYYEVTIGGDGKVIANESSQYLFSYIGYNGDDTQCIYGLENVDTSNITNMNSMFYNCGCNAMTSLDISSLSFTNVESYANIFYNCGTANCVVYVKDSTARSFVVTNANTEWTESNIVIN